MLRYCLFCAEKFRPSRSDQKFCSTNHRVQYARKRKSAITDNKKFILSLCDYSGEWPRPYRENGYQVQQIDLTHGDDVRLMKFIDEPVHGILAAPPCTEFAASGAAARKNKPLSTTIEALSIVDACLRMVVLYDPEFWVLENPVGRLSRFLGPPRVYFNPCDYGDPYTKKTGLWGKFLIPEQSPVEPISVSPGHHSIDRYLKEKHGPIPRKERARFRALTPPGFAQAFFEANR